MRWVTEAQESLANGDHGFDFSNMTGQNPDAAHEEAQAFLQQLQETDPTLREMEAAAAQDAAYRDVSLLVFASMSLERQGLEDMLEAVSDMPEAVIVFRGLPEDMEFSQGIAWLQQLAAQYSPMPNVTLDPTLFERHAIESVPTIVMVDPNQPIDGTRRPEVARVAGLSDPHWLVEQVKRGNRGDLGNRGPLEAVAERDLIEVMQEKVLAIDWAEKREQAIERFWHGQDFIWLPAATESRTRHLDPRVLVTKDITDPEGEVLIAEGTVINPLEVHGFTQAVAIFDPLDRLQMELLDEVLPSVVQEPGVQRLTLIATRFDTNDGWESYQSVTDHFDAPVYLLTPDIVERFEIERLPSVITSDGESFVVRELAYEDKLQ